MTPPPPFPPPLIYCLGLLIYPLFKYCIPYRKWLLSTGRYGIFPLLPPVKHLLQPYLNVMSIGKKVLWVITATTSLSQEECPHHLSRRFLCQSSVHCVVSLSSPISNYCAKLKCSVNKSVLLLNGLSQECIGRVGHPTVSSYRL